MLTETDPLSKVRSCEYDVGERLTSRTDPKNQEIDYTSHLAAASLEVARG